MKRAELFEYYRTLMRMPPEVTGAAIDPKALSQSLRFKADEAFTDVLNRLNINLFITREYEHLLLCLSADGHRLQQSFYPLPHPSGLAVSPDRSSLYVAATRNPNMIYQWKPVTGYLSRDEDKTRVDGNFMMPVRTKIYPGAYYFHDLAFIGDSLYGNSAGQNGVVKIDFNTAETDPVLWQPPQAKGLNGNYLQLNSIAAGSSVEDSCFSASTEQPQRYRPGHRRFAVDRRGVIFNGRGEVVARGLTRPHSARFYRRKIFVADSGYGTFGPLEDGKYRAAATLPGWTRGLHFTADVVFVGVSRILPRFEHYAPGLKGKKNISAVMAFDARDFSFIGKIVFPYGNQIFALESMPKETSQGFVFQNVNTHSKKINSTFYQYKI